MRSSSAVSFATARTKQQAAANPRVCDALGRVSMLSRVRASASVVLDGKVESMTGGTISNSMNQRATSPRAALQFMAAAVFAVSDTNRSIAS